MMKANRELEMFVKGICAVYGMNQANADAVKESAPKDDMTEFFRYMKLLYGINLAA